MDNTRRNIIDPNREIKRPDKIYMESKPTGMLCVCGADLRYGQVSCPDGKPGCLVIHYGYSCDKCGRQYR